MPINQAMLKDLQKRYGKKRGLEIYYALEQKKKKKKRKKK